MASNDTLSDRIAFLRSRLFPDHVVGEIMSKRWIDNAIPFTALVLTIIVLGSIIPDFLSLSSLSDFSRQFAEFGLVVLALTIVMISGGIDLSVAAVFSLAVLFSLIGVNVYELPVPAVLVGILGLGMVCGALNGVLIGYLRLRAFLTTLVSLIIFRSIYEIVFVKMSTAIMSGFSDSDLWLFIGEGSVFGVPVSLVITLVIALAWHIVLSRMRPGWRLTAVGGARRSAFNAGIDVRLMVFSTYVASSMMCALAGFLFAARLGSTGSDTGVGLEVQALTAAVLGGTAIGGGRGSVAKAIIGSLLVLLLTNGLINLGISGPITSTILGAVLILAVFIDMRWQKHRHRILAKIYVSPTYLDLPPAPAVDAPGSPYALNDRLRSVEIIGLGEIEGPEDVILDRHDNLYCGTRHGDIVRFLGPDHKRSEIFAHIGGHPLGMAFDRDDNLLVCIGGMGLFQVAPDKTVTKLTDETNRSWTSIVDDSRLRLADDVDIAPDGRVYFSEATIRYEQEDWATDALESRASGRMICYDPRTGRTHTEIPKLVFANGVAMCPDGQSFMFAESWTCSISRYYFDGPKKGTIEKVIDNLPGYPDNINRASDGNYWMALLGMRGPALDLALKMPGFRKRMARRVAPDQWLYPNINTGCVVKFNEKGEILDSLWDLGGLNHPMITSMREHRGWLYLGGVSNNRIGRYRLPDADPNWCALDAYWGAKP
ncbi:SMP-30/gluconolactonase/LRE family protein [Kaistia geumhonensis]|uniref:Autoinducer 2 import system permease protein LsrD n=1 Tax=Kaistia geumhonensis TaxID=410839 RepID=A0ABU0M950_9HYPH|nr:SMP-30/gluconolactonase/LRE family protein [Kaistia geumhonensis]MCX5480802.1 SMP-30/gluconolactonase/LRE family protein [Kaistia geumhonensis]MDQ0517494.1 ribose transport system permease protein [Kaistia geumhonensis]